MIYKTKDLLKIYKNSRNLKYAVKNKKIYKLAHGIYSDDKYSIGDLETIFMRYPNATLTNESAFSFYQLSEYIPEKYTIVTGIKAHKINNPNIKQFYMQDPFRSIGRIKIKTDFGYIYIYDRERMLIELFRLKTKFSYEYFKEVVENYRSLNKNNKLDTKKIVEYCKHITFGHTIRRSIEMIVL